MVAHVPSDRKFQKLVDLKCAKNEADVVKDYRQWIIDQQERLRLSRSAQVEDPQLVDRLFEAGFRSETVAALSLFPIAMAAWASGSVTDAEGRAAVRSLFTSDVSENADSMALFRCWLQEKPSEELWGLWEQYVEERSRRLSLGDFKAIGGNLWQLARRVAMASGGFLGFGTICPAEQIVLDRIQSAYGLDASACV